LTTLVDKWSQPRALHITIVVCSLAAAVQYASHGTIFRVNVTYNTLSGRGWDQTGSNGANLIFPNVLNIPIADGSPNANANQWIVGVINSG
jgi:hypothetical protein